MADLAKFSSSVLAEYNVVFKGNCARRAVCQHKELCVLSGWIAYAMDVLDDAITTSGALVKLGAEFLKTCMCCPVACISVFKDLVLAALLVQGMWNEPRMSACIQCIGVVKI